MFRTPRPVVTLGAFMTFWAGCGLFNQGSSSDGGTAAPWSSPQLEITIGAAHFGPAAPTGNASLVNSRDASGNVTAGHFTLSAGVEGAACRLGFDRFGDGATIGVGQYTVSADVGSATPSGIVYPTAGEEVDPPSSYNAGPFTCSGDSCNSGGFVIISADASHVYGYWMSNVEYNGQLSSAVCTFYLPWGQYQP